MSNREWRLPAALLILTLAGCTPPPEDQHKADKPNDALKLPAIDRAGLDRVLRENRGKVVLVDFWATWCGPCKELVKHSVDLHRRCSDRGLVVVSISLDDPDSRQAVGDFLRQQGAPFDGYISRYGVTPKSFEVFEIDDGAVPHLKLYDRDGTLRHVFAPAAEPPTPEAIDRAVEELLAR